MAREHGTMSCYKGGCRRDECRAAHREYQAEYRRRRAYGRPTTTLVNADPARAHARALLRTGMGLETIASRAGIEVMALNRLLYKINGNPESRRILGTTSKRILSISVPALPPDTLSRIDPAGTRRRVQALAAMGWSVAWQARQIGMIPTDLHDIARGSGGTAARTARRVRLLYDRYWSAIPAESASAKLARRAAEAKGWLSPLCWDDDLIDLTDAELAAECARRAEAMDISELVRCYKAASEGERSPLMVAGAARYLEVRRARRKAAA